MSTLVGSLWWFVISLGLLVTFHEFGHYWVARRNGVKVLRFSVGFGKALWSRRGRDGTEYVIAAIPLGGYVKMLDEREADVDPAEADQAFNRKSVWRRIAIVIAGPAANLLLCVLLLWAMFVVGRPGYAPVVGHVDGIAAAAGLQRDDTVLAVGGRTTQTWDGVQMALLPFALDRQDVDLRVRDANGHERVRDLKLSALPDGLDERSVLSGIGLTAQQALLPPVVGTVRPDTPAWGVLAENDRITAIDGEPVRAFDDIGPMIQRLGRQGGEAMVEVEREGERLALPVTPRLSSAAGRGDFWMLGIEPVRRSELPPKDAAEQYGPLEAVPAALREMRYQTVQLFEMVGRVFSGRVSVQNSVAGPITIARAANTYAQQGLAWYLTILALLSLSLGILNLLPIPLLDGGHLLYYLIELVKGSPLSERAMAAGQYVGLALLAGLMGLAFYNDILNNFVR
ncbi:RIP metalloprotease RseP [Luteimonas mephitis]|uniref:RIP metalloprotease RseP n=1 Tax=Luteimonas mephitis TaxID=83615 RepID=UPI0003FEE4D0|nr:RIP metalloprotease RseP [Luteimonas mephitis]